MAWRAIPVATVALPLCLIAELLPIRSYTTADGLAADHINNIVVDSRGFVWFCTPEGLSRFDGYHMVDFGVAEGLPHSWVNALLETRSGEYLIGTAHGLCQFHAGGSGNAFTTYLPGNNPRENSINSLMEDSGGRIWCGTDGGLFEMLSGHSFRRHPLLAPPPGQKRIVVSNVLEDAAHRLWAATTTGIYVIGKDGGVEHIAEKDGLPNEWVEALLLDKYGRLWAATRGGLALMRVGEKGDRCGVQQVYRDIGEVKPVKVTALAEGPDRAVWAGSHAGIVRSLPGSQPAVFQILTRAQGLTDRHVTALAADRAGNMWVGTEGAGVMKIQPAGFTTFREQDGLASDRVWSVLADRTSAVIAVTISPTTGKRSVNVFDGVGFHALLPKVVGGHATWGQNQILLQSRSGEWWAATKVGLCRFPPARVADLAWTQPEACYAPDTQVFRVFEDSKGRIWASAQSQRGDQLMRWDPATNAISSFEEEGRGLVSAFAEDRHGAIWMGFWGGDLLRYDGRQFRRFKRADGAPSGKIFALLTDSAGRLWIGADGGGLGFVEDPGSAQLHVKAYNTTSGGPAKRLASDTIYCIVEDQKGRIYAGTAKGVDRLTPKTGDIKHFSIADGLAHGELTSALRDASGDLWFATKQGLSRLTPTADQPPATPSVRITDLRVGRDRYPISQVGETHIRRGDLQPSQNQFQVEFVGFNDEAEESLRYTYKLKGTEEAWTETREHTVNYAALEPGGYQFLVKAVNSEGRESTPADIEFVILPPVWRRWWFQTLALAGVACLIVAAYRLRLQEMTARVRLRYEERLDERTRIARELHDTLLQNLAGVSLQLDGVAKQIGPSSEAAAAQIKVVRRQVEASFREARQKVQDLRSPMLQGRTLPAVMRESLEQIAAGHPVRLQMTVAGQPRNLRHELEEAALRIGQEAAANAVRHAQASEIQVSLTYGDASLKLRIQDDGQGFDLDDARRRVGHWGLRNMQERAHRIGAQWKIATAAGRGTEIEAVFPLAGDK